MPQAVAIADALKRALRARGITYAALAARIGLSETSVKRMFVKRSFTLTRLDRIGFIDPSARCSMLLGIRRLEVADVRCRA